MGKCIRCRTPPPPTTAPRSSPRGWPGGQFQACLDPYSGWYVPRALGENGIRAASPRLRAPATKAGTGVAILALAAGLAACGGGQSQDASEPSGNFPVKVTKAGFPNRQRISERTDLVLGIKNAGKDTLPDLAVTIYTGEIK